MSSAEPMMNDMHPTEGSLRAYRDEVVDEAERSAIEAHLAGCADCRASLDAARSRTLMVGTQLEALGPQQSAIPAAEDALARLHERQAVHALEPLTNRSPLTHRSHRKVRLPVMSTLKQWFTTPRARRLAAAGTIVAVIAILAAFQPVRALADQLLGLFRVQKVIVLPIDSDQFDALGGDSALGQAVGRLFSDSVTVLHEPAPPRAVADAAEASRLAGFEVRLPQGAATTPHLSVQDGSAFEFTVDLARAQTILDAVSESAAASGGSSDGFEPSDIMLPEAIDGATVSVAIPAGVSAEYGDCASMEEGPRSQHPVDGVDGVDSSGCVMLAQMPSPEVTAPPEIDVAGLAETGLRFMGYSPMEAATFSHTVDWTSTLVLPIPRGSAKSTALTVDGVDGVLLQRMGGDDRPRSGYTILWVKDGRVYVVAGTDRDTDRGLALANTLP